MIVIQCLSPDYFLTMSQNERTGKLFSSETAKMFETIKIVFDSNRGSFNRPCIPRANLYVRFGKGKFSLICKMFRNRRHGMKIQILELDRYKLASRKYLTTHPLQTFSSEATEVANDFVRLIKNEISSSDCTC